MPTESLQVSRTLPRIRRARWRRLSFALALSLTALGGTAVEAWAQGHAVYTVSRTGRDGQQYLWTSPSC